MDGYIAVGELWAPLGEKGGLKMYESGHFLEKMSISIREKDSEGEKYGKVGTHSREQGVWGLEKLTWQIVTTIF